MIERLQAELKHPFRFALHARNILNDGTAQTTSDGTLSISLPAIPTRDSGQLLTLEVTATDETGLPVSARTEMKFHPANFYIGLRPDQ